MKSGAPPGSTRGRGGPAPRGTPWGCGEGGGMRGAGLPAEGPPEAAARGLPREAAGGSASGGREPRRRRRRPHLGLRDARCHGHRFTLQGPAGAGGRGGPLQHRPGRGQQRRRRRRLSGAGPARWLHGECVSPPRPRRRPPRGPARPAGPGRAGVRWRALGWSPGRRGAGRRAKAGGQSSERAALPEVGGELRPPRQPVPGRLEWEGNGGGERVGVPGIGPLPSRWRRLGLVTKLCKDCLGFGLSALFVRRFP